MEMYQEKDGQEKREPGFSCWLYDWADALVSALLIIVVLFSFIVRVSTVDGSSMVPTLHNKDVLFVSNLFYEPEVGDIVVASTMGTLQHPIVKRIIATEGQLVNIDPVLHTVTVDGKVVADGSFIRQPTAVSGDIKYPYVVPKDCYFLMGDNRNESTDSRFTIIGSVNRQAILGKVILRVLPVSDFGAFKNPLKVQTNKTSVLDPQDSSESQESISE